MMSGDDSDNAPFLALAAFAGGTGVDALPEPTKEKARACLLYGIAVALASTKAEEPACVARFLDRRAATGGARRILDGKPMPAGEAALGNAVLFHLRVQDDAHACGHFGAVVLPAALAVAEESDASGAALLAAVIAGYETALRIGRDHGDAISKRGFRTTPVYGVFGAAAAAGRLFGFDAQRMANALSLAANFAGGLRAFVASGTSEYAIEAGFAARNGVDAAGLAGEGMAATADVLNGDAGFFSAFANGDASYGRRLAADLGDVFEMESITYKPYPICQFHRGIVRGLAALRRQGDNGALGAIEIRMHPFEADFIGVRHTGPFTRRAQAFMSAPFLAAIAWNTGTVSFQALHDFDNPLYGETMARVTILSDESRARYEPAIKVALADGRTLEWEEVEGKDAYELTWASAVDAAGRLAEESGISANRLAPLIHAVSTIDDAPSIKPLMDLVCALANAAKY
jgi:2-methylcitrate dehydratase PrpD